MLSYLSRSFTKTQTHKGPISITVTGGSGQLAYNLLFRLASGSLFGESQPIILKIHDQHSMKKTLAGVRMELHDCAFPLLEDIIITDNYSEAFLDSEYAFLLGAQARKPDMQRRDLLRQNGELFVTIGHEMSKYAKKDIKVVVVANPANTNCLVLMNHAHGLPKENFSALTRLDHNRAIGLISEHYKVHPLDINCVGIWGNHNPSLYPDISHMHINNSAVVLDTIWCEKEFIPKIQKRGDEVMHMRGRSSSASAAAAAIDHMRDWVFGSHHRWVSMGVSTDQFHNHFNIPKGLVCSYPLICTHSTFHIIKHIHHGPFSQPRLELAISDLLDEKEQVKDLLTHPTKETS